MPRDSDHPVTLITGWGNVPEGLRRCPQCGQDHGLCHVCGTDPVDCDGKDGKPGEPYSLCKICNAKAESAEDAAMAMAGDGGSVMNVDGAMAYVVTEYGEEVLTEGTCDLCEQTITPDNPGTEVDCGVTVHTEPQPHTGGVFSCQDIHLGSCDRCE